MAIFSDNFFNGLDPNTRARLQSESQGYGYGGRQPGQPWNPGIQYNQGPVPQGVPRSTMPTGVPQKFDSFRPNHAGQAQNYQPMAVQNALMGGGTTRLEDLPQFKGQPVRHWGNFNPAMQGGPPGAGVRTQTPAAQAGLGAWGNKLEGFDFNKMNSGHDSPKYQFGRVMSQFDPKGGITQGMLDQLNALGLGTVTGKIGGDKISIGGNIDPRFEGVTEFDIIRDLEGGGGWQWGALNDTRGGGGTARKIGGSGGLMGGAIGAALGGGPAYAPGHAGGAPYAASSWLQQLLSSLGVRI